MELKTFSCRTCGNKFSIAQDMDQVKPIIAMDEIVKQLTAWKVQVAREDGLPQYMCSDCLAEFQQVLKLKSTCLETQSKFDHMRSLELYVAPLNTSMQRKVAMHRRRNNLNLHDAQLDHKPKSWECRICAKQFPNNQESRFKFHMKWHNLKRRLKCSMCRFSCRSKLNLKAHKRAVHLFIKCNFCSKRIRKHFLHRHSIKHLEDREMKMANKQNVLPQATVNVTPVASTPVAAPPIAICLAPRAPAAAVEIPEAPTVGVATASSSSEAPAPAPSRRYSLRVASATRGGSKALQLSNKQESRKSYLCRDKESDHKTEHVKQNTLPRI